MDILEHSYAFGRSPLGAGAAATHGDIYLFGGHIASSLSPRLHGLMFAARGVPWRFHLTETTDADRFTAQLQDPRCLGTSITMPNKVAFCAQLDGLTDEARAIGAVNTSFVRLDRKTGRRTHIGANTDCVGIRDAILARFPDAASTAHGRPAMVLGAGGAARSAVYALWRWFGATEIYVVNRLHAEADDLIASFAASVPAVRLRYVSQLHEMAALATPAIVVGTVPDLPPQDADEVRCRALCDAVLCRTDADKGILLDMCYMPSPQTTLYTSAADNGWRVVSGTEVIARVCIAQQILWLEQGVDEATAQQAVDAVVTTARPAGGRKATKTGRQDRQAVLGGKL
ncbi:hypothetical protein SCUCBS95973_008992 [Sporothrix curviconia]|uniref:Shikimate dehydrogenase substrate binding N-terminal domain-containing protein n=1 Tax=Sporothrix curviconia TaxID=1260050 RepID=A0ABP0CR83_9PEZI